VSIKEKGGRIQLKKQKTKGKGLNLPSPVAFVSAYRSALIPEIGAGDET
jgi:hypothetical protein